MFQSPLEDFPGIVINRRNLVEQDLAPPVNHCYGKDFLLAIADKLDGITPPPAPPSDNTFRLGLTLNQITVNPNPKFNQQPGTMGKDLPQPKRFIVEPKTIALIERITGRIDDLDVPHTADSYDDEQSSEGEEAQVQKEKSVVAVASKKPKKIRPISENSNLLKYTSSSISKIKGPHSDSKMVAESKTVKSSAKISSNSDIHARLYRDGMRQKEARESASSLANLPKPIVPSPLESLQKIKNELLTVHSINQRRKKPKHDFHEANLKRIKETQRVSQESLERRELERKAKQQPQRKNLLNASVAETPKKRMNFGGIGLSVKPDLDVKFSSRFRFRPVASRIPRNPLLTGEIEGHHRRKFREYISRVYQKLYHDVNPNK